MRMLVTGGAGFIGSHFVLEHCARFPKDTIVVLDALVYASDRMFLASVEMGITFVHGRVEDAVLLDRLIDEHQIDTIVHFAAESHVDRSIADPEIFLRTNVLGTQVIIDALRSHPGVRLLHISTDEVFGDLEPQDAPRSIGDPFRPSSPYAASKAAAEMCVMAAIRTYQLPICVSRCTNNYGPHQASDKLIPTIVRCALGDKPIPIYGDGKQTRDWLFVRDHCHALHCILGEREAFTSNVLQDHFFHIAAQDSRDNLSIACTVLDLLGKSRDLISFVADRPGHDRRYALDDQRIRGMGWAAKVSMEEGMRQTVDWYAARGS